MIAYQPSHRSITNLVSLKFETGNNMIVYSIPFLTGVNIGVEQFGELYKNPKILGVKFTAGDFYLLERLKKAYPNHLIWAGFDEMMLPAMSLGGKLDEARAVQHTTNDLIEAILENGLYLTIKEILKLQGVDAGFCREPMTSTATPEQITKARELKEKFL